MHVLGRQFVAVFLLLIGAKMALDLFGGILDADVGSTPEFLTTLMGVGFLLDSVIKRALMAADAEKDLESQDMA